MPPHSSCLISDIDAWTLHFDQVFNPTHNAHDLTAEEEDLKQSLFDLHAHDPEMMLSLNKPISVDEVEFAFAKLPNFKAAGADGITAECFKTAITCSAEGNEHAHYILAPIMTSLLNAVFIKRDFPSQFAINTLTPI